MKPSDFKKLPKGTYAFDNVWGCKQPIKTSLVTFQVEFFMCYDKNPPDEEMLRLADQLTAYTQTNTKYIGEIIYGFYRYCVTEYGADSVENSQVPADLKPEQIGKYCEPVLVVERDPTDDLQPTPYSCRINVNPKWEPEHNLSLEFRDGAIVTVNRSPFEIVKGILRQK